MLTWGGLRGAITIALALGIVRHLNSMGNHDVQGQIIFAMTYAVVVFSIVCQGLFFEQVSSAPFLSNSDNVIHRLMPSLQACVLIQDASYRYLKHGGLSTFKSTHSIANERESDRGDPDDVPDLEEIIASMNLLSKKGPWPGESSEEVPLIEASEVPPAELVRGGTPRKREPTHLRDESVTFHGLGNLKPIPHISDVLHSAFGWARTAPSEERARLLRRRNTDGEEERDSTPDRTN